MFLRKNTERKREMMFLTDLVPHRTDKKQTAADKVKRVEDLLAEDK